MHHVADPEATRVDLTVGDTLDLRLGENPP